MVPDTSIGISTASTREPGLPILSLSYHLFVSCRFLHIIESLFAKNHLQAGLFESLIGKTSGAAIKIYQITYIFGFVLGSILFIGINHFYPPPGLGIDVPFDENVLEGVEGVVPSSDGSESSTKEARATTMQVSEKIA